MNNSSNTKWEKVAAQNEKQTNSNSSSTLNPIISIKEGPKLKRTT